MKFSFFISLTILACACSNNAKKENGVPVEMINNPSTANNPSAQPSEFPIMSFETTEHSFGDLMEGQEVEATYKFTNTGKTSLLIDRCDVTCGCTTPDYPKHPIKAGESGTIKVKFNSSGKVGNINKNVVVWSNIKDQKIELHFTASVKAKEPNN